MIFCFSAKIRKTLDVPKAGTVEVLLCAWLRFPVLPLRFYFVKYLSVKVAKTIGFSVARIVRVVLARSCRADPLRSEEQIADKNGGNYSDEICHQSAYHGMACFAYAHCAKVNGDDIERCVGTPLEYAT